MSAKTVFISYRRDVTGRAFARSLKQELTRHGYDVFFDVDSIDGGKWADQILTEVPVRSHFLLLLTPGALDRCVNEDDWVRREFEVAVQSGRNIVPIREESVDLGNLRAECRETMKGLFDFQIATVRQQGFESEIRDLIGRYIPPHKAPSTAGTPSAAFRADISRIIKYAPAELIGREDETKRLNDAWEKVVRGETKRPHVITFVALGGEGKTSLVAKWAADLAHQSWPGCEAVFAWSFYHQGTDEKSADSSDLFLKEALTFFGDTVMADSAQTAYEKGRRLALLIGQQRSLLILDGIEPLQYSPTSPTAGELKDAGLAALLKGLAAINHGLCLVTTRYSIPDLRAFWQTTAPEKPLVRLSKEAGIALLLNLKVRKESGSGAEFEKLVEDVKGHALTLNLLGTYLRDAHGGDIRKRDLVKLEEADAEEQGGHAFRVMDAYVKSFESEGKNGIRALAILRLLGLFERPATANSLKALLKAPRISNLTEPLVGTTEAQRNLAFTRLEFARLITVNCDPRGVLVSLDGHPLVRDYFATQLRMEYPGAWREAHRRLYKHLIASTHEGDEPTLEDLQPLYQAVAHGCQAGLSEEVRKRVFHDRIRRGAKAYTVRKLSAFGSDLSAIACMFKHPWHELIPGISESGQGWLMNEAAYCLRALGRLSEGLEPMRAGMEFATKRKDWSNASRGAGNLSELKLTLGDVAGAAVDAEQAMVHAENSSSAAEPPKQRAKLANALHQAGRRVDSRKRFREAEALQAELQPDYPLLYSQRGFQYCDLLLAEPERAAWNYSERFAHARPTGWLPNPIAEMPGFEAEMSVLLACCGAVYQRAMQTLHWVTGNLGFLNEALDQISMGRATLYRAILEGSTLGTSHEFLQQAVDGLRRAGEQTLLPHALLTCGWLYVLEGNLQSHERAEACLDEAWEIAERGPMRLFMADIHLYRARLFGGMMDEGGGMTYPWDKNPDGTARGPKDDLAAARKLIEQCGYWRRKEELEDAEEAAKGW